jgi:hypothetical protein
VGCGVVKLMKQKIMGFKFLGVYMSRLYSVIGLRLCMYSLYDTCAPRVLSQGVLSSRGLTLLHVFKASLDGRDVSQRSQGNKW